MLGVSSLELLAHEKAPAPAAGPGADVMQQCCNLMSDKTFQLKCKAPMPGVSAVLTVSPSLPQATVVVSNAEQSIEGL